MIKTKTRKLNIKIYIIIEILYFLHIFYTMLFILFAKCIFSLFFIILKNLYKIKNTCLDQIKKSSTNPNPKLYCVFNI